MANCIFPKEFGKVSGTLASSKHVDIVGRQYTQKLVASVTASGKQKIYMRRYYERCTQPSAAELAARQKFKDAAAYWKALDESQVHAYAGEFRRGKYKYNGKKYASLRGYVVARFCKNDLIE